MTQHDTCDVLRAQIEDLTQTQLTQMQIPRSIADHARSCVTCKAFLDQQLALAAEVDLWAVPEPQGPIGTGVMTQIAQLERDMHQHIHKENNVLFPKAIQLEQGT